MNQERKDWLIKQVSSLLSSLPIEEKREILHEVLAKDQMPISVFKANLAGLEIITKYLKENEKKSFKEISAILNRKVSTLYNTYGNSRIKFRQPLDVSDSSINIPFKIFSNRKYSILETIVVYLKDKQNLSVTQIALLLHKNYHTIKTVYRRYAIKKRTR